MSRGYGINRKDIEKRYIEEKLRQPGIAFPSAKKQGHILIARFNLTPSATLEDVRNGLGTLCGLFERVDSHQLKMEQISDNDEIVLTPLSDFLFTATLGFGIGFFKRLDLPERNIPKGLYEMPDNIFLDRQISFFSFVLRKIM